MRQRIFDKLRDRGGVTILMALFAMLVASMVCIVILGAAVSTAKQEKTDQAQEQLTLDLQSAGEVVLSEIKKAGTLTFSGDDLNKSAMTYGDGSCAGISVLSEELRTAARSTLGGAEDKLSGKVTIGAQGSGEQTSTYSQAVTAEYILKPNAQAGTSTPSFSTASGFMTYNGYQLVVTLSVADPNSNSPQYLFLKASYNREFENTSKTYTYTVQDVEHKTPYTESIAKFKLTDTRFYLSEDAVQNG